MEKIKNFVMRNYHPIALWLYLWIAVIVGSVYYSLNDMEYEACQLYVEDFNARHEIGYLGAWEHCGGNQLYAPQATFTGAFWPVYLTYSAVRFAMEEL